ncbi:unnamed protein product [Macrosiphum euphorbiae]|uniref:Uncharacterized protein n=1 Tax=Macrosiphum euphorbiae TaxID=13131 RepID=A0AAV0X4Y1_9HEMI|nr:unnamed protein product [Macrosiphum euphorbiae]
MPPRSSHVDAAHRPVVPPRPKPSQLCFRIGQPRAKSSSSPPPAPLLYFFLPARKPKFSFDTVDLLDWEESEMISMRNCWC